MRKEKANAQKAMEEVLFPFKSRAEVQEWRLSYGPEHYGKATWFKFLVLEGDSKFAKPQ